ncbi:acetoacetate metabolism regulatory protein AtoC [Desulfosarcina widdelii]|uniref:Acetoacetate metabolism regulatory protein AtoC n=1 Tax=Desulfosarcina widdelii TaxID=947919 RepID=A0A5K7ZBK0_9BACT|nr:sigma-54 dependent transcriptional regulator [Desulfosarcina widdelii]BBO73727.1 acetoacetate metabolism regulatory protein AtoC [Desulfosarcina widdelii]
MVNHPISVLLVTSESELRHHLYSVLEEVGQFQIKGCATGREAIEKLEKYPIQILYSDMRLNDFSAVALSEQVQRKYPDITILIGAAKGTAGDVIAAMQAGATDFILDPFENDLVWEAFQKAARDIAVREGSQPVRTRNDKTFITQDVALLGTLEIARKVAPSTASILITGESGTGKELLAAFIHAHSQRSSEPYVAINCAALPEQLAESELFGHEKGAFTGAISRKIGKFESAGKGTLVLDEITEMALPLQAKLLRALQEREIVRVGSNRSISIEARVIAISNRMMKEAMASGNFREDLYYRLNVIPLTIPPLRERKNDIPLMAEAFLKRFSSQNGKKMDRISGGAMDLLMRQNWPGNVRELENTIERGVLIGGGETLLPEDLILDTGPKDMSATVTPAMGMTVREMEKQLITNTLQSVNDNRTHAAKMLGISIRTLRNKLNEYKEEIETVK